MDYQNNPVPISELPRFEILEFQPLDKNFYRINVIGTIISWLVILTPIYVISLFIDKIQLPIAIPIGLSVVAILSSILAYYSAKARGYILRDHDVLYKEGIWWQKRTGVSFKRIQHIDITHGPIERKFGLASIKFFTAGGSMADLRIPGLPKEYAEQMREIILNKTGKQNGDE